MPPSSRSLLTLPGAIVISGALIAIAIIWIKKPAIQTATTSSNQAAEEITVPQVTATDHILGNPDAPIKLVEYSDPSCQFCKQFDPVMHQFMDAYGPDGKVAWVYRHFPTDRPGTRPDGGVLHPNAGREAHAFECAAALGGNDAFWKFEEKFYQVTPSDTGVSLDQKELPEIAKSTGLDPVSFNECMASGRFKDKINREYDIAFKAGIAGTPTTIVITPSGKQILLPGAVSYATLKNTIDILLESGLK